MRDLDANGAWWFAFIATARWIGFRLDAISAVMLTVASILAMAIHDKASSLYLVKPSWNLCEPSDLGI